MNVAAARHEFHLLSYVYQIYIYIIYIYIYIYIYTLLTVDHYKVYKDI